MTGFPSITDAQFALWAANPFATMEFFLTIALLVGILFGGALVLLITDNWRKRRDARALESTETLTHYRRLYDRGELTEAEYRKIRDRVATQMKLEVAVKNPAAANAAKTGVGPQGTETNPGVQETRNGSEGPPQKAGPDELEIS